MGCVVVIVRSLSESLARLTVAVGMSERILDPS
jgi:hypothetical protein